MAATALFSSSTRESSHSSTQRVERSNRFAWKVAAGLGAALSVIGVGQLALTMYPAGFGSMEWEFATTAQLLGALPLPTVGLATLLAALHARDSRPAAWALSLALALLGLAVMAALSLHLLAAPVALQLTPAPAIGAVKQAIARTTLNGVGFSLLYLAGAAVSLRHLARTARRTNNA